MASPGYSGGGKLPPTAAFGSNFVGVGGAWFTGGGGVAKRACATDTAPTTGTAKLTLEASAAAITGATWGVSKGWSGGNSSVLISGWVFGCSSGGVKTTGTGSTGVLMG